MTTKANYIPYREWTEEKKQRHREHRRNSYIRKRPPIEPEWAHLSPQLRRWKRIMADPEQKARYLEKKRLSAARRRFRDRDRQQRYGKAWRLRRKQKAIDGYGGKCKCCGEVEICFLTIDHVNNDGSERRRNGEGSGDHLYAKLIREGFPPGYQVLCMNCNFAKGLFGSCPHELKQAGALV